MMVNVEQLKQALDLKELTSCAAGKREVKDGCVCDLLSWVMARGEEGMGGRAG